jgi:hypothetical protein
MKMIVFWDVAPFRLVEVQQGSFCLHHQGFLMKDTTVDTTSDICTAVMFVLQIVGNKM